MSLTPDLQKSGVFSCIYQFIADNLICLFSDVIHPADPLNLIPLFKLLSNAFAFHHLIGEGVRQLFTSWKL